MAKRERFWYKPFRQTKRGTGAHSVCFLSLNNTPVWWTEQNNEMLRQRYRSTTRAQAGEVQNSAKFAENNEELASESEAYCFRRRHFPISKFIRKKVHFGIYVERTQSFLRLFCERIAARKTTLRSNRIESQPCKRLKIRFVRQNLAHAQMLNICVEIRRRR